MSVVVFGSSNTTEADLYHLGATRAYTVDMIVMLSMNVNKKCLCFTIMLINSIRLLPTFSLLSDSSSISTFNSGK